MVSITLGISGITRAVFALPSNLSHMNYNLHKTRDNRYFEHGIQIHGMLNFHEVRNWFSQTYGFASNLSNDLIDNEHWSFHMVYQTYMIYVKGDEELSWFKIRYGDPS